jgi:hypothetical protein
MIMITEEIENLLSQILGVGYYSEFGAVIGDAEFVIYYKDNDETNTPYLAHISEFEQDGVFIKLKDTIQ